MSTELNNPPHLSATSPHALLQRVCFRWRSCEGVLQLLRKIQWRLLGAKIGTGTRMASTININWPHQVVIGNGCILEEHTVFTYPFPWRPPCAPIQIGNRAFVGRYCEFNISEQITIGDDALIASGCKFIDHDHSTDLNEPTSRQPSRSAPIVLEDDVWLGVNVVVLKGVTIGKGAVVGASAVVTKSIPPYEIWAGIPARRISERAAANDTITTTPI